MHQCVSPKMQQTVILRKPKVLHGRRVVNPRFFYLLETKKTLAYHTRLGKPV